VTHSSQLSPEVNLRLVWPQWQGVGTVSVHQLASEFPFDVGRRGYAVGSAVLEAVLPPNHGPTVTVPVAMSDEGLAEDDGVEAKAIILKQLASALEIIRQHNPTRIATLGGECSVSVAPFSALANRYGDDLAVIWIDSHPDLGTGESEYPGYHAMAVSALTGHGDADVLAALPATVAPDRVALVGLHAWTNDDYPHVSEWGLAAFAPDELRESSKALLAWLADTSCSKSRYPLRCRHHRQQRDRAGSWRRTERVDQCTGAAHGRRHRPDRRCRRAHDRRVHPPTGDAPAADPQGLPPH
jgi:arginase